MHIQNVKYALINAAKASKFEGDDAREFAVAVLTELVNTETERKISNLRNVAECTLAEMQQEIWHDVPSNGITLSKPKYAKTAY